MTIPYLRVLWYAKQIEAAAEETNSGLKTFDFQDLSAVFKMIWYADIACLNYIISVKNNQYKYIVFSEFVNLSIQ